VKEQPVENAPGADLSSVPPADLVAEIRSRSALMLVAVRMEHGPREANVRIFMWAAPKTDHELALLGLANLAPADVERAARTKMSLQGVYERPD
jgi:hypothetical protein